MGDYRPEHLFSLQQALESYRHFENQIAACDQHIERMLAHFDSQEQCAEAPSTKYKAQGNQPTFDVPSEMHRILGVDLTAIPGLSAQAVLTFFCEVGPQITRFPSSKHFASWLGLCPDNRISGGKILSSKTRNVRCRLANALRMAATTLYRSHSALGDYFRRLRARLGSPPAITAAAHKLARILFAMLRDRRSFDPQQQWAPALEHHVALFGRAPRLAAADRGYWSAQKERLAAELGVEQIVCRLEALCVLSARSAKRSVGSGADRHGGRALSRGSPPSNIALECSGPSTKEKQDSKDWRFVCLPITSWL